MIHILTNRYTVVDPHFGGPPGRRIELDLGCGKGRFTLELAERFPERLVLGGDVMLGRLRKLARKAERRGLANVALLRMSSRELVGHQLPDRCISRVHLLCPDPWPKARHRGKRLATTDFFTRMARVLEPGGVVHVATDHTPYLNTIQRILDNLPCFVAAPEALADLQGLQTDFELRWQAQGKKVPHFAWARIPI